MTKITHRDRYCWQALRKSDGIRAHPHTALCEKETDDSACAKDL